MARIKIDYGIDLGTTNSAIARMENGESIIKKSDTLKDTLPSCVYINKKKAIQVGDSAFNALKRDKLKALKTFNQDETNSFIEFKRTMGNDKKYNCKNADKSFSSEELSSEVLKTLKSFISDESIKSAVVTVPAKFTINQKDATLRAAKLAGLNNCELLQEPIAASMAYGLDRKNDDGYWLVFDFGGGTFDTALIKVEDNIMKIIDTEGDNFLGGKNLDYAIVDEIVVPYLQENYALKSIIDSDLKRKVLQDAMKFYAEETKIQMSFNETHNILSDLGDIPGEDDDGEELELDITVTQELMKKTLSPFFQKAINLCKDLLKRNNLVNSSLSSLILVGGPTYSPILRKMLEEQILKPDLSVDPMTVVAKGAALFASTINVSDEIKEEQRDRTKIQLEFGFEATTVEEEEFVTVKLLKDEIANESNEQFFVELVRNDKAWSSGKIEIDGNGEIIEVKLNTGKANLFTATTYNNQGDMIPSEPSDFTIIQGTKIGSATLPYNIGIEIKSRRTGKVEFRSVKGLEKNQSTPAVGTTNGLITQQQIRPGMKADSLKIPIYQGDYGSDGTKAIYNEHVYDIIITGDDLPKLLPEGSDVDLTIKVDKSERITHSAYFPILDYSHEIKVPNNTTQKEIDSHWLEEELSKAIQKLDLINQDDIYDDQDELKKINLELADTKTRFEQGKNDYDRKKDVLNNLRKTLKKLDKIQDLNEWPKIEKEMEEVFVHLKEVNIEFGTEQSSEIIEQFNQQIPEVIKEKNVKVAQELIDNIRQLDFALLDQGLGAQMEIMLLKNMNDHFDTLDWNDRTRARNIINEGFQIAANNPSKDSLRDIIRELYKLLPNAQKSLIDGGSGNELIGE